MIKDKLKAIIIKRIKTYHNYDYGINLCWQEALDLVKENPEEALEFIKSYGTDEEIYFLSERLCEIYEITLDDRFVEAFNERAENMTDPEMTRSIKQEIEYI